MNISVVILTKNDEKTIENTLKSVSFADEISVIDDFSTDNTLNIAQKYKVRIFNKKLKENYSSQRNFGLEKSSGEWILFLDADEVLTPDLKVEIQKLINNKSLISTFYIKRRDIFWGRELKYGELWNIYRKGIIRLVKKDSGKWVGAVHEKFVSKYSSDRLKNYIDHYSHESLKDFIADVNSYSTIRAKELYKSGKQANIFQIFFVPFAKFKLNYIFKLGFLDGVPGFIYSFMMSFHSFLVRAKLYQYNKLSD